MKNFIKALLLAVMLITFALSACTQRDNTGGGDSNPPASTPAAPTETVVVNATDDSVEVEDIYLNEHDFTVYFEMEIPFTFVINDGSSNKFNGPDTCFK